MKKIFKYSAIILQPQEEEKTFELRFEDDKLVRMQDVLTFSVDTAPQKYRIASVQKVNPILTPNLSFDYQLIGIMI